MISQPSTLRPRWDHLHRDEDGQISILVVFGAVLLVSLLGLVITTGDQVNQKVEVQNAVDAAALSGGAWIARGLNITSGFNLMQTQLVAGAILLKGLDDALPIIQGIVFMQNVTSAACMPWPPCIAENVVSGIQLMVIGVLKPVVQGLASQFASCPGGLFWLTAKALEWVNSIVHSTFYLVALAESQNVGRGLGMDYALFIPGPVFHGHPKFTLPTRRAPFREHCDSMVFGSRRRLHRGYHPLVGYGIGVGPYTLGRDRLRWLPRVIGGFPGSSEWRGSIWVYDWMTHQQKEAVCNGSRCGSQRPDPYLLDDRQDGLSFFAIAHRPNRKVFFRGTSVGEPPDFDAYAQVEIYNGVNGSTPDAYTQDWRVRLAPASLLERSGLDGQTTVGSALDAFSVFSSTYLGADQVDVSPYLWQVGNH